MEDKHIRFINSSYHNLFTVPDGGTVVIKHPIDGLLYRPCKYVDETHAQIGNYLYHICEFAEKMEKAGCRYMPEHPEMIDSYKIVKRMDFDNNKGVVMGYSQTATEPFATWEFTEKYGQRHYENGKYRKRLATAKTDFEARTDPHLAGPYPQAVAYQFDNTAGLPKYRMAFQDKQGKPPQPKDTSEPSR